MNDKCCKNCIYIEPPRQGSLMSTCEYPVPEYIRDALATSGYINGPRYSGTNCSVFKSRLDVMEEVKNGQ